LIKKPWTIADSPKTDSKEKIKAIVLIGDYCSSKCVPRGGLRMGIGKPTILLARHNHELLFNVRGHRCSKWRNIQDCKKLLVHELVSLKRESDIENYFVQFSLLVATEFS
jgi:hypothetical protein